jgi:hypothetical protein
MLYDLQSVAGVKSPLNLTLRLFANSNLTFSLPSQIQVFFPLKIRFQRPFYDYTTTEISRKLSDAKACELYKKLVVLPSVV